VNIIGGDLHSLDPMSVYNKKRICSIHFTENDTCPGSNRLKNNALPTLHLPGELTYLFIIILLITLLLYKFKCLFYNDNINFLFFLKN